MQNSEVIDRIHSVAAKTMPKGSNVLLYGSRARGDYNEDSDWDLSSLLFYIANNNGSHIPLHHFSRM